MLDYLAVQQAMVNIHKPIHLETILTCSPGLVNILLYTLENGFQGTTK